MDFSEPIAGEMGFSADPVEEQLTDAAQAIVDGIAQIAQLQQQALMLQAQQLQMMSALAQSIGAKRRVVRDETGRVIGSEIEGTNGRV